MSVSVYFVFMVALILVLDSTGLAFIGLICVFIHECGHIVSLYLMGIKPQKAEFRIFGINIKLGGGSAISYKQEIILALSGCAANFAVCLPAYILYENGIIRHVSGAFFAFSFLLGCFNLMPVVSLDGGVALEALLCLKFNCGTAALVINILSVVFLVPTAAAGFYLVIKTGYNISLIAVCAYIITAMIVKSGKKNIWR